MGTHVQVDSLYVATAQFMPHHMDSIAAFQGLKVLHMDRHTMAGAMDSAAFAVIGELTQLEELVLAPQLTGVDDEGFMLGLGPLQRLRRLELYGLERVRHLVVLHMPSWTKCAVPRSFSIRLSALCLQRARRLVLLNVAFLERLRHAMDFHEPGWLIRRSGPLPAHAERQSCAAPQLCDRE